MNNHSATSSGRAVSSAQGHLDKQVDIFVDTNKQKTAGMSKIMKGSLSSYGRNYYIQPGPEPRFPELQTYPFDETPYRIPYLTERHLSREKFQDIRKEYKEFFAQWDPVFRKRNGKGALKSLETLKVGYPDWTQDNCTEEQYAYWCCYWNQSRWMM
ncbi:hypothetical protein D9619_012582 [Psilocybe cf. subviscida]|uniref:Uncharacterized protein n=1 Tax=Psilocybe cf. subviscida TaxID=2480587 RepID=A0A8H5B6V3_9AGAR|nr:hypothetical protein D9619_012582 [Psilocybe cf. subviscida]